MLNLTCGILTQVPTVPVVTSGGILRESSKLGKISGIVLVVIWGVDDDNPGGLIFATHKVQTLCNLSVLVVGVHDTLIHGKTIYSRSRYSSTTYFLALYLNMNRVTIFMSRISNLLTLLSCIICHEMKRYYICIPRNTIEQ